MVAGAALVLGHVSVGCVGEDNPGVVTPPEGDASNPSENSPGAKDNGAACTVATECASGNCADGVCCDSPCDGTCEKCSLPGSTGRCEAIADGEDPDDECPTTPLSPDAGGGSGGDAGGSFVFPDGGVAPDDNQCAGKCNGKRACAFAGSERTCGTAFCGSATHQGRASCDGKGHCLYGIEECSAYACSDGSPGCKTMCTGEADCLPTHFCDAVSSTCKPKVANGSACSSVAQCKSGFCIDQVCCNDACEIAGGTCKAPGSVGSCRCSACATGPCELFYRDEDGDGYGDSKGTIDNGRAAFGCVGQPPAGFVANKDDCYDGNPTTTVAASVRPNQTGYFASSYTPPGGVPTFDYDCDGKVVKETEEILEHAGACGYCSGLALNGCSFSTKCSTKGQRSNLSCGRGGPPYFVCNSDGTTVGFTSVVACGVAGLRKICGTCPDVGQSPSVTTSTITQRCR
ncbi:MAG: hypothetical protein BGO98_42610 [Myxococcales bacterium 68-20]|nr:MAG: hypothetical protein BGO98_42610 [Myxococcales bacterium 68-20]